MQLLLQWKSHEYYVSLVCVCSLSYTAGNAHAPYYIVISKQFCSTAYFCFISRTAWFSENSFWIKICFNFLYNFRPNYLFLWRIQWDIIKMYWLLHVNWSLFLSVLIKLEFSRRIFEKYSNINFHEYTPSRGRVVSCGRTDKYDEANRRFT